jgi:hypothetical protein
MTDFTLDWTPVYTKQNRPATTDEIAEAFLRIKNKLKAEKNKPNFDNVIEINNVRKQVAEALERLIKKAGAGVAVVDLQREPTYSWRRLRFMICKHTKKWAWTIALFLLVVADSLLTIHNEVEESPLILWVMAATNWSLETTMYVRIVYYIPLIWIVHKYNYAKLCVVAYISIYIVGSIYVYGM